MATREWILRRSCEHFIEHVEGANTLDDMAGTWEGGGHLWAGTRRGERSTALHAACLLHERRCGRWIPQMRQRAAC
jgi:hypothetical protein